MSSEDGKLVLAARAGDPSAWDLLVARFGSRVWAVARSHGLNTADSEDVFQVTFLRLVTHLDDIRDPDCVGAWLAITARHECLRLLQRAGRQIPTAGDADELEPDEDLVEPVDAAVMAADRDSDVAKAFTMLHPRCQRLLRLLTADPEPSYAEVSDALAMPVGSIGPTRRRCLDRLRIALEGINGGSGGSCG